MKPPVPTGKSKKEVICRFLEGDHALAHVNPAAKGVQLPPHLAGEVTVTLKLSHLFRGYLEIGDDQIVADLLFSGRYFTCVVPFEALWGCSNEKGESIVWSEAATPEIMKQIAATPFNPQKKSPVASGKKKPGSNRPKPSYLKRIK